MLITPSRRGAAGRVAASGTRAADAESLPLRTPGPHSHSFPPPTATAGSKDDEVARLPTRPARTVKKMTKGSGGNARAEASDAAAVVHAQSLPPRLRRTLQALLDGDSEKEAAKRMGLSPHTVHEYVRDLYRHFGVRSRAELLSRWIAK